MPWGIRESVAPTRVAAPLPMTQTPRKNTDVLYRGIWALSSKNQRANVYIVRVWNWLHTQDTLEYSRPPDLAKSGRGLCLRHLSVEIKKYCSELAAARIQGPKTCRIERVTVVLFVKGWAVGLDQHTTSRFIQRCSTS